MLKLELYFTSENKRVQEKDVQARPQTQKTGFFRFITIAKLERVLRVGKQQPTPGCSDTKVITTYFAYALSLFCITPSITFLYQAMSFLETLLVPNDVECNVSPLKVVKKYAKEQMLNFEENPVLAYC